MSSKPIVSDTAAPKYMTELAKFNAEIEAFEKRLALNKTQADPHLTFATEGLHTQELILKCAQEISKKVSAIGGPNGEFVKAERLAPLIKLLECATKALEGHYDPDNLSELISTSIDIQKEKAPQWKKLALSGFNYTKFCAHLAGIAGAVMLAFPPTMIPGIVLLVAGGISELIPDRYGAALDKQIEKTKEQEKDLSIICSEFKDALGAIKEKTTPKASAPAEADIEQTDSKLIK